MIHVLLTAVALATTPPTVPQAPSAGAWGGAGVAMAGGALLGAGTLTFAAGVGGDDYYSNTSFGIAALSSGHLLNVSGGLTSTFSQLDGHRRLRAAGRPLSAAPVVVGTALVGVSLALSVTGIAAQEPALFLFAGPAVGMAASIPLAVGAARQHRAFKDLEQERRGVRVGARPWVDAKREEVGVAVSLTW
jgi:hypothetical protein